MEKNFNFNEKLLNEYIHQSMIVIDDYALIFEKITNATCLMNSYYDFDSKVILSCLVDVIDDLYSIACNYRDNIDLFSDIYSKLKGFEKKEGCENGRK